MIEGEGLFIIMKNLRAHTHILPFRMIIIIIQAEKRASNEIENIAKVYEGE